MWVGEIKPNQAISSPCVLFIWVVVIGPILVSIDLIAFAMAMPFSAEQPVMPSSLAAQLREQGGTWQVLHVLLLQYCTLCMSLNYICIYITYIYIYICSFISGSAPTKLLQKVQSGKRTKSACFSKPSLTVVFPPTWQRAFDPKVVGHGHIPGRQVGA